MKKYAYLLIFAVLAFSMLSCSGKKDTDENIKAEITADTVIQYWHVHDGEPQKSMIEKIVADFKAAHEGEIYVVKFNQLAYAASLLCLSVFCGWAEDY